MSLLSGVQGLLLLRTEFTKLRALTISVVGIFERKQRKIVSYGRSRFRLCKCIDNAYGYVCSCDYLYSLISLRNELMLKTRP